MILEFDPQINLEQSQILLVGCGGTGSSIATQIGRILYELKCQNIGLPKRIAFIDPDIVTKSNIGRQNFLQLHLGMPKCEVLVRQINYAYGLKIEAHAEAFSEDHLYNDYHISNTIIIGAVDNHHARRDISQCLAKRNITWIDSGNSRSNGQVLIGNTDTIEHLQKCYREIEKNPSQKQIPYLPSPSLVLPELLEAEKDPIVENSNLSCAQLIEMNEQDLLINQQMAITVSRYLYNLFRRKPVKTHATYVGSFSTHSLPITQKTFEYGWKLYPSEAISA
jgi:PRTRC genetic system ThiF family protein